jgi:hypothetical protein
LSNVYQFVTRELIARSSTSGQLNLRRSNRHEQEIPIGVDAGLRHGIRAGNWQCGVFFKHPGPAAAFGAAAKLSLHTICNRPAATAGYSAIK